MAPSMTRRLGTNDINGDSTLVNNNMNGSDGPSAHQNPSPSSTTSDRNNEQQMPATTDDGLSREFRELHILLDNHVQEMQNHVETVTIHFQYMELGMYRRFYQVASGEGSSQVPTTRVPPWLITCQSCKTSTATMVYYPCRHLCLCLECDTEISNCPICNNIKQFSFMINLAS